MQTHQRQDPARAGSAILIAMAVIAMLISLVVVSTDRAMGSVRETRRGLDQQRVVAAVEAVLARREQMVVQLGNRGDPTEFSRWRQNFGIENYGVDFLGDCEVRWKIEPMRTPDKTESPAPGVDGEDIPYIVNPSPSATSLLTGLQLANDYIYLFRIAAEARINGTLKDVSGNLATVARAQGVRYASVAKQPLFRYVIFYAQDGAKGDLELSHASSVNIRGNVHSNGAIYVGSSTLVNTWTATKPTNLATVIGPDAEGNDVFVTGVNGIFRLSKPLMFGAINTMDPSWSGLVLNGAAPGSWTPTSAYSTSASLFPTEKVAPDVTSVYTATKSGTVINPYRVLSTSGFITLPLSGADTTRTINGVPLVGNVNDSRDHERTSKWNPDSLGAAPTGFGGYARTALTTGRTVTLPGDLTKRPLEAQAITEVDSDSDPTTDNHESAVPMFRLPAGPVTATTADLALLDPTKPWVEAPGRFLTNTLGSADLHLTRLDNGAGWVVTDKAGTAVVPKAAMPTKVGLLIRERAVPNATMWPGTSGTPVVDPSSPLYMPYAYGKHWRPTNDPFLAMDVVANTAYQSLRDNYSRPGYTDYRNTSSTANIGNNDAWRDFDMTEANRLASYAGNGVFNIRSACGPGPGYAGDTFTSWDSGFGSTNRPAYFFQENWRFLHLRKPKPTTTPGVVATYWNDPYYPDGGATGKFHNYINGAQQATLSGSAALTRQEANVALGGAPGSGVNADFFSGRWEGYLVAPSNGTYQFGVLADDCMRVWVNNTLVVSQPSYQSGSIFPGKNLTLRQGGRYPLVCEFSEGNGGEAAQLYYRVGSAAWTLVPTTQLVTREPDFGFSWKDFRAMQARIIVPATVPAQAKIGIMVRPAEGASPMQNGRDPYASALFSPIRGFFTQRRILPAVTDGFQRQSYLKFVGSTTAGSPTQVDGSGVVPVNITPTDPVRQAVLTPNAPWATAQYNQGLQTFTQSSTEVRGPYDNWGPWLQSRNNIAAGDGTFLNRVYIGPSSGFTLTRRYERFVRSPTWSRWRKRTNGTLTLDLTGQVPGGVFTPGDESRWLNIHSANVGTGVWQAWDPNWYTVDVSGIKLSRYYENWNENNNWGSNQWGGMVSFSEQTVTDPANDKAIFPPLPNRVNASGANLGALSVAETIALMDSIYGGGHYYKASTPSMPNVPAPADDGVRPGESGAVPEPAYPALNDPWGGPGVSRTFNIDRGSQTITGFQDVNSYATTGAHVFSTPQEAFLPWQSTWTGSSVALSVAEVAMTTSFPPSIWRTNPAPQRALWDASTDVSPNPPVDHAGRWAGDLPASWGFDPNANHIVRIERDMTAAVPTLRFYAYVGPSQTPLRTDPLWFELPGTAEVQPWIDSYKNRTVAADPTTIQLLAGLVVQSGDKNIAVDAQFADVAIETATEVIDGTDWDAESGGPRDLSRYLASQYQVLWGSYDITEDFFSFGETNSTTRLATEDWIFNAREFWSQSRWWDDAKTLEKDWWPTYPTDLAAPTGWRTTDDTTNRQLLAKTTLLTLNMRTLQDYMRARTLTQAVIPVMTNTINGTSATGPEVVVTGTLSSMFNGLFYAVRTNRYPWNPEPTKTNAWGPRLSPLPNSGATANINMRNLDDTTWPHVHAGVNLLQPYPLTNAPPIKPQDFLHAVRIVNGSSIDWGIPASGIKFGDSKTSIATPSQLFVQGNLNSAARMSEFKGINVMKETPLAIMGDVITLLSNRFRLSDYQTTGLTVGTSSVGGNGILRTSGGLSYGSAGPGANDTTGSNATIYNTSILTHNAPTTKTSVREGQGAPFIDTMLFLESWPSATAAPTMRFKGSLVVMNSRRYTRAFLLDAPKTYGRTPLGITGWHKSSPDWYGSVPAVYSAPFRGFDFNTDLLSEEGTPPFTPFGVTAAGIGGYTTILQ